MISYCILRVNMVSWCRKRCEGFMLSSREEQEYTLLGMLAKSDEPVGSVLLSLQMDESECAVSSATIGRLLSDFDRKGYTLKHGYRGRTLTATGRTRLTELANSRSLSEFSSRFHQTLDVGSKKSLLDVLTARRGIEREMARLAALNATQSDIRLIYKTFELQNPNDGRMSGDYDVAFHQAIARASKNQVLAAAFDLIWQNGKFTPVMEYIRTYVGGVLTVDHTTILTAIENHEPELAELRMVHHIDSLISDVTRYWSSAERKMRS